MLTVPLTSLVSPRHLIYLSPGDHFICPEDIESKRATIPDYRIARHGKEKVVVHDVLDEGRVYKMDPDKLVILINKRSARNNSTSGDEDTAL
jgi:hypothetical protein